MTYFARKVHPAVIALRCKGLLGEETDDDDTDAALLELTKRCQSGFD